MSDASAGLMVEIEATATQLKSELAGAARSVADTQRSIERSTSGISAAASGMTRAVGVAVATAAAAVAGAFTIGLADALTDDIARLNDMRQSVGMTATELQEFRFAADRSGVDVAKFDSAMLKFTATMAEARAHTGSMYARLKEGAPDLLAALLATNNQSEALRVLATYTQRATDAETQAVIAKAAFGAGSVELSRMLADGSDGLANYASEAHRLGLVLSNDAVTAGAELRDEFELVSQQLNTTLKQAIIDLGPVLKEMIGWVKEGAVALSAFMASFQSIQSSGTDRLRSRVAEIRTEIDALDEQARRPIPEGGWFNFQAMRATDEISFAAKRAGSLRTELAELNAELSSRAGAASFKPSIMPKDDEIEKDFKLREKVDQKELARARSMGKERENIARQTAEAMTNLNDRYLAATHNTLALIGVEYDRELAKFQTMLDNKQISQAQFADARVKLEKIAAEQIAEVAEQESAAMRANMEKITGVIEKGLSSAFAEFTETGQVSFAKMTQSMLADMAKLIFQVGVLKPLMDSLAGGLTGAASGAAAGTGSGLSGVLGSVLNGIFAPGRAAGGAVVGGRPYVVGERGPELFVPQANGAIQRSGGGGSASVSYHIDARGADGGLAARLPRILAEHGARVKRDVIESMGRNARRFPAAA